MPHPALEALENPTQGTMWNLDYLMPDRGLVKPPPSRYPAKHSPEDEAKLEKMRTNPHEKGECKYSVSVGLVVFPKGCEMPCVITEKRTEKLGPGLEERGPVQSLKHIKVKPLGSLDHCANEPAFAVHAGEWMPSTECSPLEKHFNIHWFWHQYDPRRRAYLLKGLQKQLAFYPDMSAADLFQQLCPPVDGEKQPTPPELE